MKLPKIVNIQLNRKELTIIVILLIISISGYLLSRINNQGSQVQIEIAQKLYGNYDLSKEQEIKIIDEKGDLILTCVIKNNSIKVATSNCPDKICIDDGSIGLTGQTIVCLPNQVVIRIIGDDNNIDGVLQ